MNYSKENELYHYGVLGMRWGVHKGKYNTYSAKAKSLKAKAKTETRRRKKLKYLDKASDYEFMAKTSKKMSEAKGIGGRLKAKYGQDTKIAALESQSKKYASNKNLAPTRYERAMRSKTSFNTKATADTYKMVRAQKTRAAKVKTLFKRSFMDQPYETLGGRRITAGRSFAESFGAAALNSLIPGAGTVANIYSELAGYSKNRK